MIADRDQRASGPSPQEIPGEDEEHDQDREREVVEPLIGRQLEAERRVGLGEDDALRAAGPVLEVLQDLRHGQRQREGRQRQVEALQPQRGNAEEEPDHQAHDAGDRDRQAVADVPLVDHDRRRVRAERVEGAVPERDLPVVAGQDVEAEQRDRVDRDLRELEQPEVREHERQPGGDRDRGHGRHDTHGARERRARPRRCDRGRRSRHVGTIASGDRR